MWVSLSVWSVHICIFLSVNPLMHYWTQNILYLVQKHAIWDTPTQFCRCSLKQSVLSVLYMWFYFFKTVIHVFPLLYTFFISLSWWRSKSAKMCYSFKSLQIMMRWLFFRFFMIMVRMSTSKSSCPLRLLLYSWTKNIFSLSSPVGHSPSRLLSDLTGSLSVLERTYLLDHYVVNPEHSFVRRSHRISLNTRNQLLVHLQNESTLGIRNCQDLFSATLFAVLGFNCRVFFLSLELCKSYSKLHTFSTVFIHMWGITTTISVSLYYIT